MAFESVKQSGPTWEPKQTGSKKEDNLTALEANDKSHIDGYYLGSTTGQGPDQNSTIHKLKVVKVGDKKHIIGDVDKETKEVSIWGTNVLNDNISKATPGQLIRVVWLGKKKPKQGSNHYHNWDVLIDKEAEPLVIGAAIGNVAAAASPQPEGQTAAAPVEAAEEEDDLPF